MEAVYMFCQASTGLQHLALQDALLFFLHCLMTKFKACQGAALQQEQCMKHRLARQQSLCLLGQKLVRLGIPDVHVNAIDDPKELVHVGSN